MRWKSTALEGTLLLLPTPLTARTRPCQVPVDTRSGFKLLHLVKVEAPRRVVIDVVDLLHRNRC